jgi:hypothetical protein
MYRINAPSVFLTVDAVTGASTGRVENDSSFLASDFHRQIKAPPCYLDRNSQLSPTERGSRQLRTNRQ